MNICEFEYSFFFTQPLLNKVLMISQELYEYQNYNSLKNLYSDNINFVFALKF